MGVKGVQGDRGGSGGIVGGLGGSEQDQTQFSKKCDPRKPEMQPYL